MDNASALVSDAVGEFGQRLDNALAAMDEDVRLAMEGPADDGNEVDKAVFYRDQLLEFQMEQIRLTREYQALVIEKDSEITKLKEVLEEKGEGSEVATVPTEGSMEALQLELEVLKTTGVTWEKKLRNVLMERNEAAARANRSDQRVQELEEKAKALQEQVALHAEVMENFATDKLSAHTAKEVDEQTIDGLVDDYSRLAAEAQEKEEAYLVKIQSLENQNEELKLKNRVLELNVTELMTNGSDAAVQSAGDARSSDKPKGEGDLRRQVLQLQMELCEKEREISSIQEKSVEEVADARTVAAVKYQRKATDAEERAEELEQRLKEAEQAGESLGQRLAEMQSQLDSAQRQPSSSSAPSAEALKELEQLRARIAKSEEDLKASESAVALLTKGKEDLSKSAQLLKNDLEEQIASLRTETQAKDKEVESLRTMQGENVSQLTGRIEELVSDAERFQTEVSHLKREQTEKEEKIKALESRADQLEKEKSTCEATIAAMGSEQSSALEEAIAHAKEETRSEVQKAADKAKEAEIATVRNDAQDLLAQKLQRSREEHERAMAELKESLKIEHDSSSSVLKERLETENAQRLVDARAATRKECENEEMARVEALESSFKEEKKALEERQSQMAREHEECTSNLRQEHSSTLAKMQADFDNDKSSLDAQLRKEKEDAITQLVAKHRTEQENAISEVIAESKAEKEALVSSYEQKLAETEAACQKAKDDLENVEVRWRKLQEDALQQQRVALDRKHQHEISQVEAERQEWEDLYKRENQKRKLVHNKLMELQGNIRVMCRTRPILPVEQEAGADADVTSFTSPEDICITREDGMKSRFEYDRVFQPGSLQSEVFEAVEPLVTSLLDGYNVCIFAYGQTGSGKTYTMEGPMEDPGVNLRALQTIFDLRAERASDIEYRFKFSMLEIYNEQVRDLLETQEDRERPDEPRKLDIRQSAKGNVVPGLTEIEVDDVGAIQDAMARGAQNRAVGGHNMNERSSRSHSIVRVRVLGKNLHTGEETRSKLHLIDLAGSERISKTDATGDRLKEAQNINRSLSALGDVIAALASRTKGHVPFRNSKLTFLLQDSLGGNSKVMMFVNISPAVYNVGETLCSLNFAARCRAVELGSASRNVEPVAGNASSGAKEAQRRGAAVPRNRAKKSSPK